MPEAAPLDQFSAVLVLEAVGTVTDQGSVFSQVKIGSGGVQGG